MTSKELDTTAGIMRAIEWLRGVEKADPRS